MNRTSLLTDADGRFEFSRVPAGEYLLEVHTFLDAEKALAGPRAFYPGVAGAAAARTIVVPKNRAISLDRLVMPAGSGIVEVKGVVRDAAGRGLGDAQVHLYDVGVVKLRADGTFTLSLAEGRRYSILVQTRYDASNPLSYKSTVRHFQPSGASSDIVVVLE